MIVWWAPRRYPTPDPAINAGRDIRGYMMNGADTAWIMGSLSASYTGEEIFIAMAITCIIVVVLTLFAFQTKVDFTMAYGKHHQFTIFYS